MFCEFSSRRCRAAGSKQRVGLVNPASGRLGDGRLPPAHFAANGLTRCRKLLDSIVLKGGKNHLWHRPFASIKESPTGIVGHQYRHLPIVCLNRKVNRASKSSSTAGPG